MRGVTACGGGLVPRLLFQPTRPVRGVTVDGRNNDHRAEFQPTRPVRGVTAIFSELVFNHQFQPTRPVRGVTMWLLQSSGQRQVSTHTPRAGRDPPAGDPHINA